MPDASPPVVIRTDPPGNKRDVPLNANLVIVFSEPIAPTTLTTSTVQLRNGNSAVDGQLGFANDAHTAVVFQPSGLLAANTNYSMVVTSTSGIQDQSGNPLVANVSVQKFTTTTATTTTVAPVASVTLSVTATTATIGSTVPLTVVAGSRILPAATLTGRTVSLVEQRPRASVASVSLHRTQKYARRSGCHGHHRTE